MKRMLWISGALAFLVAGCSQTHDVKAEEASHPPAVNAVDDDGDEGEETEEVVALDQVPAAVKAAAIAAVPGFVPSEAEKETERGSTHYCIHGHVGDEFVEVEVDLEGNVLEIERGEDDEDD